ncbi:hypothetical protein CupriaWKF_21240 [Cupriavidus sp. WKF15]|uniref:hypothetical protein n=1 Tax=Cupriavidus sp. WKF15 TaxID=3032282 RepID=UPI0023E1C373|nr:hypothetical protein [Cupriavidus sp. WKF15]WER49662.1 hypothetical protein CupriaWKF_21240 [Cupriavidus sp. WKF15]
MVAVKFDDLSMALDFVSSAAPMDHNAYVSLDTGQVYWTSDFDDDFDDEIPDDLETSDRYLRIKTSSILEEISPSDLSHKSCLSVMNRLKHSSDGHALTLASKICWRAKAFSNAGIRLKPTLSKER